MVINVCPVNVTTVRLLWVAINSINFDDDLDFAAMVDVPKHISVNVNELAAVLRKKNQKKKLRN